MFNIVICSYNRNEIIKNKTLKFLYSSSLVSNDIYIFTPQKDLYIESLKEYPEIKIRSCPIGLNNARNEVIKYFDFNTKILFLDDDITKIFCSSSSDIDLNYEINKSFYIMDSQNICLGGINPTNNPFFSSNKIKTGYYFCLGACYFFINDKVEYKIKDELEDYERTILSYQKYGIILRNDKIYIETLYNQKGGMFDHYRNENRNIRSLELKINYPKLCYCKKKKDYLGIILKKLK